MSVPYIIGFVVLFVLQTVASTIFLKVEIPKPSKKSLILKASCSTIFVVTAVVAAFCADNFSSYAITMLVGLVFGWIGDYFLHAKPTNAYFATGKGTAPSAAEIVVLKYSIGFENSTKENWFMKRMDVLNIDIPSRTGLNKFNIFNVFVL